MVRVFGRGEDVKSKELSWVEDDHGGRRRGYGAGRGLGGDVCHEVVLSFNVSCVAKIPDHGVGQKFRTAAACCCLHW